MPQFAVVRKMDGLVFRCLELPSAPRVDPSEPYELVQLHSKAYLDLCVLESSKRRMTLRGGVVSVLETPPMRYAGEALKTDNTIFSTWSGGGMSIPSPDPSGPTYSMELSQAEYQDVSGQMAFDGCGIPCWAWDIPGANLVALDDPRPIITFTPVLVQDIAGSGPSEPVVANCVDEQGAIRTDFNDTIRAQIRPGAFLFMVFSSGIANFDISKAVAMTFSLGNNEGMRTESPLVVDIGTTTVGA